jgi:RNA polymerase sigma factor (sigma-70 family)
MMHPDTLRLAKDGDLAARDLLLQEWLPVVLRWSSTLGGPRVDPEEAAHDVLMVLLRRMDRVYDADRLPAWLFGVTRRTVARHRRRAWVRYWMPGVTVDRADPSGGPARLYEVSETSRGVQQCLEALPELDREILVLRLYEQRPDSEVAELLAIPIGTVKSRLHRARDRFIRQARAQGLVTDAEISP